VRLIGEKEEREGQSRGGRKGRRGSLNFCRSGWRCRRCKERWHPPECQIPSPFLSTKPTQKLSQMMTESRQNWNLVSHLGSQPLPDSSLVKNSLCHQKRMAPWFGSMPPHSHVCNIYECNSSVEKWLCCWSKGLGNSLKTEPWKKMKGEVNVK
jgi:hypothetical protein